MNIPLYSELANKLREHILSGKLKAGEKLSSERDLCENFNASRITIRQALAVLEKEQLLVRVHGSGTYVSERPRLSIPIESDFTLSMQEHAPQLKRKVIEYALRPADIQEARTLKIPEASHVLAASRIDILKGQPTAWDKLVIAQKHAEGITRQILAKVNFLEVWAATCQLQLTLCEQRINALAASEEDARLLQLNAGDPVLYTQEVYIQENTLPAGFFITHYNPQLVGIRIETPLQQKLKKTAQ